MNRTKQAVIIFLILEAIIVSIFSVLIILDGRGLSQNIPYALVLMLSPAILAIAVSFAVHKNIKYFGWGLGKLKYLAMAYAIPILYITIPYFIAIAAGWVLLDPQATSTLGAVEVLQFFLVNILILCVLVMGEEIGWRGFLLPQLCKLTSFAHASTLVGVVWVAVHLPIFIFADYNAGDSPLWFRLICFTILALSVNIVINWLRIKSGSLWTAVLLHATHNSFLQDISPLFQETKWSAYILSEAGLALTLSGLIIGFIFWRKRNELENYATNS